MKLTRIIPILALSLALVACGGSAASSPVSSQPAAMVAAPAAPAQSANGGATALDQGKQELFWRINWRGRTSGLGHAALHIFGAHGRWSQ